MHREPTGASSRSGIVRWQRPRSEPLEDPTHYRRSAEISVKMERTTNFDTRDTDTDMSSLDHANIIRTITDGEQYGFLVLLYKFNDQSLLEGRYTT